MIFHQALFNRVPKIKIKSNEENLKKNLIKNREHIN